MADNAPSAEKLRQSRLAGQVAISPLLVGGAALAGVVAVLAFDGPTAWGKLVALGRQAFSGQLTMEPATVSALIGVFARVAIPILCGALLTAWLAGLVQTRGLVTLGALAARRPPPAPTRWLRWAAGAGAVLIVAGATKTLLSSLARTQGGTDDVAREVVATLGRVLPRILLLLLGVGLVELGRARSALTRSLSMTRAEKQAAARREEGNPQLRAESRRRQRG